jgi:hypothetical protein
MNTFGNLQQVDLREGWAHEAFDFTQWLVKSENLQMLSDEIGIEIAPIESEAKTGRYSVDILAEEENTGRKVIIENQLEQTDHDHLGKLITYASGLDAEYVVWIVKDANDEHRQALEWLNDHTGNELNFFLLKLELWKIDDSNPAVKFNTIVKPNEWTKTLREQSQSKNLSETKLMQLDFWQQFKTFCKEQDSRLGTRKAFPQHWYDISIGRSEGHISLTVNTRDNEMGCELYISDDKNWFDELYEQRDVIESEIGTSLEWMRLDDKKASRIKLSKDFDFEDRDRWPDYFEWLKEKADKFKQVFGA